MRSYLCNKLCLSTLEHIHNKFLSVCDTRCLCSLEDTVPYSYPHIHQMLHSLSEIAIVTFVDFYHHLFPTWCSSIFSYRWYYPCHTSERTSFVFACILTITVCQYVLLGFYNFIRFVKNELIVINKSLKYFYYNIIYL